MSSAVTPPPSWDHVGRHDVFPEVTHDEVARFNFLASLNKHIGTVLSPGNKLAFDTRVEPSLKKQLGRDPQSRHEIRRAMNADSFHQFWSALRRNTMEMRQQAGRSVVLRQAGSLAEKAAALSKSAESRLVLDPELEIPNYIGSIDNHCMPGSYHTSHFDGDVTAGANYDVGLFVTTAGMLGALSDGGGVAVAEYMKKHFPDFKPRRILDVGCTVGHNVLPIAMAYPDAEVIAIDLGEPVLRYAHARAQSLGVNNITFMQANAEQLDFEDGYFDWVQTTMFLHETSKKSMTNMFAEFYRLLAPGGFMLHVEQPQYTEDMPLYEQFIRDWDAFNNNEPFWTTMHEIDIDGLVEAAGFKREDMFTIGIKAKVDTKIFPEFKEEAEDHGRSPSWHAFGARKAG